MRAGAASTASEAEEAAESVTTAGASTGALETAAASTTAFLARGLDALTALASPDACTGASSLEGTGVAEDFSVDLDALTMLAIILYYYVLLLSNLPINILYYIFIVRPRSIVSCKIK